MGIAHKSDLIGAVSARGCLATARRIEPARALLPSSTDRDAWSNITGKQSLTLVNAAEAASSDDWPDLTAALYRRISEDGNRAAFEEVYFARRRKLDALVLGEVAENTGRFLNQIEQGIALICAEPGWQLPAHNKLTRGGPIAPDPDPQTPIVDLFAAETAAQLATIHALLGATLGRDTSAKMAKNVRDRVLLPYLAHDWWWTGRLGGRMNNWTTWSTLNVLLAAFSFAESADQLQDIMKSAAASLDSFLAEYGEDGGCPEGAYYYGHAGLCLYTALDLMNKATLGRMTPLLKSPKLRAIAEYILYPHISGDSYANFGDAPARMAGPDARVYRFGQAVGSNDLMGFFTTHGAADDPEDFSLYNRARAFLDPEPKPQNYTPREGYLADMGMFVARDARFFVAATAGHNGADHNHNDVGSVTIYRDGHPVLIDAGVETYSAKTFSPDRYDIWTMQSSWHNLPDFGGVMQKDGADYRASDVRVQHNPESATLDMDLTTAYPAEAQLSQFDRHVALERGDAVVLRDTYASGAAPVLNLLFAEKPQKKGDTFSLSHGARIQLRGAKHISGEDVPITDARLAKSWDGPLHRLRITPAAGSIELRIT